MITLLILHAPQDLACAHTLLTSLESQGYHLWREPHGLQANTMREPRTIESALLGSTVILLLWSVNATHANEVTRHIPRLLDLKKTILPLLLDQTELPIALRSFTSLEIQSPCTDVAAQLVQQALLPPPDHIDSIITLAELAASNLLADRKAAVKQAEMMLQQNDHRTEVCAILTDLAHNDLMSGVREKAQSVLATATQQQTASPPTSARPQDARYLFAVRCKNGHTTTFDKRKVCAERREILRGPNELILTCPVPSCGVEMAVDVDCEGY